MSDDEFMSALEATAFTRAEWTHEAHVRMAWLYITRFPTAEALERVRTGIQKLNASFGNSTGYHETITVTFVRLIGARLAPGEDYSAFRERNPDLLERTLTALLHYYTRDRLHSPEARAGFIEPDLEPLPVL
jgi:hypothetical protein